MKRLRELIVFIFITPILIILSACGEAPQYEHLPEYCRTYADFSSFASIDIFQLVEINKANYMNAISEIELSFEKDDLSYEVDLDGLQCFQNLTSLSLEGRSFKDISEISALKNIQKISLENTHVVSIDSFRNLSKVNHLTISNTKTLQSVKGVEEMTKLIKLELSNNGIVDIYELNALTNLIELNLSNNDIKTLPSIRELENLQFLNISNNRISDLGSDLSGLRYLKEFNANNNKICDISILDNLENLELLDLSFNNLGCNSGSPDFSSLDSAEYLVDIKLNDNGITSIEGLRDKNISPIILDLRNNQISDLSPIANFTSILQLELSNNEILNISDLSGMTNLTSIDLSDNLINNFDGLSNMDNLEIINLTSNHITSIPNINSTLPNLKQLILRDNQVSDTSGVKGHQNLQVLDVSLNNLEVLRGISDLPKLNNLRINRPLVDNKVPGGPGPKANAVIELNDSFNNLPELVLVNDNGELVFDIPFGNSINIINSFNGLDSIEIINFDSMGITSIDSNSFNLENIEELYLKNNDITNVNFVHGMPKLKVLDLGYNGIIDYSGLNGIVNQDDDLDKLEYVKVTSNPETEMKDAFNGMASLNTLSLPLITSFTNSLNDLPSLNSLDFYGNSLNSIESSFNNLFSSADNSNNIQLSNGQLAYIKDSFNGGYLGRILISDNNHSKTDSIIENSFNDITLSIEDDPFSSYYYTSLVTLNNNTFKNIKNSFNGIVMNSGINCSPSIIITDSEVQSIDASFTNIHNLQSLQLNNNEINTINSSLLQLDVIENINLSNNRIDDLTLLDNFDSLLSLDLSKNKISTVSMFDSMDSIQNLNLSYQADDLGNPTLTRIDGLNNLPSLSSLNIEGNAITSIDGLKNTGLNEFVLSAYQNQGSKIISISSDSFTDSSLSTLNLSGHDISNMNFLENINPIEILDLSGNNISDITVFNNTSFKTSLLELYLNDLANLPLTTDFTPLQGYNKIDTLEITGLNFIEINNLDNLNKLEQLLIDFDNVEVVNNSFNNVGDISQSSSFGNHTNLQTINNSFNVYDSSDTVTISQRVNVFDSFKNIGNLNLISDNSTTINIDDKSFEKINSLIFHDARLSDFSFINNFVGLDSANLDRAKVNITNINNPNITSFSLSNLDNNVDIVDIIIDPTGSLDIGKNGNVNVTSNVDYIQISTNQNSVVLNSNNSRITVSIMADDFTVNSATSKEVIFSNTSTVSTVNLNIGSIQSFDSQNAIIDSVNINTLSSSLSIDSNNVGTYDIDGSNIDSLNINSSISDVYLSSSKDTLNLGVTANNVEINDALLNSVLVDDGSVISTLSLETNPLITSINNNKANINTLTLITDVSDLYLYGENVLNVNLTGNNLTNLDSEISRMGSVNLYTDSITLSNHLVFNSFSLYGQNLETMSFDNSSNINNVFLQNNPSLKSFTAGSADIGDIFVSTDNNSLNVSSSNTDYVSIDGEYINDLTISLSNSNVDFITNETIVNVLVSADTLNFDSNITNTLSLDNSSTLNNLVINDVLLANVLVNSSNINSVVIDTFVSDLYVLSSNTETFTVNNNNISSIDGVTSSLTNLFINSSSNGTLDVKVNSENLTINGDNYSIINFINNTVTNASLNTNDLSNLTGTTAHLDSVLLNTQSPLLLVDLPNTNSFSLNGDYITFANVTINTLGSLDISSTVSSNVLISSNVSTLDLDFNNASSLLVTGDNVSDLTILASGNVDYSTTYTGEIFLNVITNSFILNGNNLTSVKLDFNSNIDDMILNTDMLNVLNTYDSSIDNIELNTMASTLNVLATSTNDLVINDDSLDDIVAQVDNSSNITLTTQYNLLITANIISGVFIVNGNNLSNVILDNSSQISSLLLNTNALTSLLAQGVDVNTINITSNELNLDLNINATNMVLNTSNLASLKLINNSSNAVTLTTEASLIDITAPLTNVLVNGDNISNIKALMGSNNLTYNTNYSGNLTLSVEVGDFILNGNGVNSVVLNDLSNVDKLILNSNNIALLNTQSANVDSIETNTLASSLDVTSNANNLLINGNSNTSLALSNNQSSVINLISNIDIINVTGLENSNLVLTSNPFSSLNLTVNMNLIDVLTGIDVVNITAPNIATLRMNGYTGVNLKLTTNLDTYHLDSNSLISLDVTGSINKVNIDSSSLNSLDFTNLLNTKELLVIDSQISDLEWITQALLTTINQVTINSLDKASNMENIINKLHSSNVNLVSNIYTQDIKDYYYDTYYQDETSLESSTNDRFNSYLDIKADNALTVFRGNGYFDYIIDEDLLIDIKSQNYLTTDQYFNNYLISIGKTENDLILEEGQEAVDAIKISIQGVLDNEFVYIDFTEIRNLVNNDIIFEATTYSNNQYSQIGFNESLYS